MLPQLNVPQLNVAQLWAAEGIAFRYFDWGATFLWACTGAVLAARRGYDLTGIFAIALVSSTGGGLLRDALFLQAGPPMLVRTPSYVVIALLASVLTWLVGERLLGRIPRPMVRLTLTAQISMAGAMLVGVVNAVGGGVLRNLLLHRTPEIFRPGHLTALAA